MSSQIVDELVAVLEYKIEGEQNIKRFNSSLDDSEDKIKKRASVIGASSKRASDVFDSSERRMRGGIDQTNKGLGETNVLLRNRAALVGSLAGAFTATAAVDFTGAAFKQYASLQRQMTRIGITAEATAEQTAKATKDVQNLAIEFGFEDEQPAVLALDTLTASGLNLIEAMEFLPSVLATAQASGALTSDIANTALKTASALNLQANESQKAFDIMVAGGKEGQFELRDMAQYIPELANLFSSLGYEGEEGLKVLIALLQTVREDTGSAGAAATQLRNVFAKMNSAEMAKRFEEMGIDLTSRLKEARESGEDVLQLFVEMSKQAIGGDLSKLPLLFRDQELLLGMQSLITSQESFDKFIAAVNSAEVDGSVFRDLNRVMADTQAEIDKLSSNWNTFKTNFGGGAANVINPVLEALNDSSAQRRNLDSLLDEQSEIDKSRGSQTGTSEDSVRRAANRILDEQGIEAFMKSPISDVIKREELAKRGAKLGLFDSFDAETVRSKLPESSTLMARDSAASINNSSRSQSVTNNINIEQNVAQASDAPRKLADASAGAVDSTLKDRAQLHYEPAQP